MYNSKKMISSLKNNNNFSDKDFMGKVFRVKEPLSESTNNTFPNVYIFSPKHNGEVYYPEDPDCIVMEGEHCLTLQESIENVLWWSSSKPSKATRKEQDRRRMPPRVYSAYWVRNDSIFVVQDGTGNEETDYKLTRKGKVILLENKDWGPIELTLLRSVTD